MSDFNNENLAAKSFAEVDMSVLLDFENAQGEGEPDLIVELIDLYLEDVPPQLSAMKNLVTKNDAVSIKRAAHNLKGSSANLGANAIARLCEKLEQTDSIEQSKIIIDRLEQAFEHVQKVFTAERSNRV